MNTTFKMSDKISFFTVLLKFFIDQCFSLMLQRIVYPFIQVFLFLLHIYHINRSQHNYPKLIIVLRSFDSNKFLDAIHIWRYVNNSALI